MLFPTRGWAQREMGPSPPFKDSFELGRWPLPATLILPRCLLCRLVQRDPQEAGLLERLGEPRGPPCSLITGALSVPGKAPHSAVTQPGEADGWRSEHAKDTAKLPSWQAAEAATLFRHPAGN